MAGNNEVLVLAIEIIDPDESATQALADSQIEPIKTDSGVAFAYDEKDTELFDDLAEDELLTIQLGLINVNDGNYYESPVLTHMLAQAMGDDVDDDDIDPSILPELGEVIDSNEETISKEKERVIQEYYYAAGTNSESSQTSEVSSESVYDPSTNTFSEPSQIGNEYNADGSGDSRPDTLSPSTSGDDGAKLNINSESTGSTNEKETPQVTSSTDIADEVSAAPDTLLRLAAERWLNSAHEELPAFDAMTHQQLQRQLVNAEASLDKNRNDSIFKIYNRYKDRLPELEKLFEVEFKGNKKAHEDALANINSNEEKDVKQLTATRNKDYDAGKEKWIQSQRQTLDEQYDAEHRESFNQALNVDINNIHAQAEAQRHEEERKYSKFKADQKEQYIETHLSQVDVSDVVDDFNELVNQENTKLIAEAKKIAVKVKELSDKYDELISKEKEKAKSLENQLKTLKETYNQQLSAETETASNEKTADLSSRIKQLSEQLQEAHNTIDKLSEANDVLNGNKRESNSKIQDLNAQVQSLIKQLNQEKSMANDSQERINQLTQQNQQLQQLVNNQANIALQSHNSALNSDQQIQQPKKNSIVGTIISVILAIVAIAGLAIGGTAMYMHMHSSQEQSKQQASTVTQPTVSDKINSNPTYKKGDSWTYRNSKDNRNYTVTMDNARTGHYTDKDGQQHTVTLLNQ